MLTADPLKWQDGLVVTPYALTGAAAAVQARAIAAFTNDVEHFKRRYVEQFARVLNADNASELFDEYAASEEARARFGLAVRAPAAVLIDSLFADLLAQPTPQHKQPVVYFAAGGNAAGKSSSVSDPADADIIFDSTLSVFGASLGNVEHALVAGRDVRIRYIWRDPRRALMTGALPRALGHGRGRIVTIRGLAATHIGSRDVVLLLAHRFRANPRVSISIRENAETAFTERDLDWLRAKRTPNILPTTHDATSYGGPPKVPIAILKRIDAAMDAGFWKAVSENQATNERVEAERRQRNPEDNRALRAVVLKCTLNADQSAKE